MPLSSRKKNTIVSPLLGQPKVFLSAKLSRVSNMLKHSSSQSQGYQNYATWISKQIYAHTSKSPPSLGCSWEACTRQKQSQATPKQSSGYQCFNYSHCNCKRALKGNSHKEIVVPKKANLKESFKNTRQGQHT